MYISYDYYKIFYYVAKCGSFTRAADILLSNQPNLTRAIKNLEQELGCTLFERSNKGVKLTDAGEHLFLHVSAAVEHFQAAEAEITENTFDVPYVIVQKTTGNIYENKNNCLTD